MIGAIWNIRGTGKAGHKQALADLILDHKLEFVGILETKTKKISSQFLDYIAGSRDFSWVHLPANKTAGDILVGLRNDLFDIVSHCCYK